MGHKMTYRVNGRFWQCCKQITPSPAGEAIFIDVGQGVITYCILHS